MIFYGILCRPLKKGSSILHHMCEVMEGGGGEESTLYVANEPYSPPLPATIIAHIYWVDPGGGAYK